MTDDTKRYGVGTETAASAYRGFDDLLGPRCPTCDAAEAKSEAVIQRARELIAEAEQRAVQWESDYHKKDAHHQACISQRDEARRSVAEMAQSIQIIGVTHHTAYQHSGAFDDCEKPVCREIRAAKK